MGIQLMYANSINFWPRESIKYKPLQDLKSKKYYMNTYVYIIRNKN